MANVASAGPCYSILAALPAELAALEAHRVRSFPSQGLDVAELDFGGVRALACVAGVGKVNAAQGAAVLFAHGGTRGLFVVGVCGGLRRHLGAGTLVHCDRAVETDLALRAEREVESDPALLAAWTDVAPGRRGWFLTADRPVFSLWRRLRLARAFAGDCVADMETSAAARAARRAGVPWAALRAVTDGATESGPLAFGKNFAVQAGRAAATLPELLRTLQSGRQGSAPPAEGVLAPPGRPQ